MINQNGRMINQNGRMINQNGRMINQNGRMINVSWEEIDMFRKRVVEFIKYHKLVNGIYGIPRGGSVLATCLSHDLHLPLLAAPTEDSIVVDDIADTGKTLQHYKDRCCMIITFGYCEQSIVRPDLFQSTKDAKDWMVFPWETIMTRS